MNNTSVDSYLAEGCGRCELFRTPQCKVHRWADALRSLRAQIRETGLIEVMKWGAPCYTLDGHNILMISALRDSCVLSFFRGAEIDDPRGLLAPAGPNSRYARLLRFTSQEEVAARRAEISAFIADAIALQRAGSRPAIESAPEPVPDALAARLAASPGLAAAFEALTPGRRRSHILHVAGAKQAETRARRVDQCAPKILAGKGYNER